MSKMKQGRHRRRKDRVLLCFCFIRQIFGNTTDMERGKDNDTSEDQKL